MELAGQITNRSILCSETVYLCPACMMNGSGDSIRNKAGGIIRKRWFRGTTTLASVVLTIPLKTCIIRTACLPTLRHETVFQTGAV